MKGFGLFIVNALYMLVSGALYPLIPLYLEQQSIGVMERGYILTGAALASAASSLFWGYLSDRTGKRRVFVLLSGLGQIIAYLLLSTRLSLPLQVAIYLLSCFISSASFTLVMASAGGGEEVSEAMGNFWAGGSLGWAAGTAISGYIFEGYGISAVFLFSTAFLAFYTLIAFKQCSDLPRRKAEKTGKEGFPPRLLLLLVLVFVFICVDVVKNLYIPPHYAYDLKLGAAVAMLTLSFTSWLEIPSILTFSRAARKISRWFLLALSFALAAMYLLFNCFVENSLQAFAVMGFYSLVWGSFSVSSSTLVSELTEAHGTAYGAYNAVYSVANIAAPVLSSIVIGGFGYNTLLWLLAVVSLLIFGTLLIMSRRRRL